MKDLPNITFMGPLRTHPLPLRTSRKRPERYPLPNCDHLPSFLEIPWAGGPPIQR